jgi:hypothetical protein
MAFGFDAENGEWVDMIKEGIVDPTKVTRSAILNASSISALFVTTEAAVTEIKEEKPAAAAPGHGRWHGRHVLILAVSSLKRMGRKAHPFLVFAFFCPPFSAIKVEYLTESGAR